MSELTSMMNIGKEIARKLTSVGIDSPEKLIELGSKQAFLKLREAALCICSPWRVRFTTLNTTGFPRTRRKN